MQIEVEVLKVEAKKDGMDRMYKVWLQTTDSQVLELQKYIADETVVIGFGNKGK